MKYVFIVKNSENTDKQEEKNLIVCNPTTHE